MQDISDDEKGQFYSRHFYHVSREKVRHGYGYTTPERINHSLPNLLLLQCSFHTLSMPVNANAENSQHCDWIRHAISGDHRVSTCSANTQQKCGEKCTAANAHQRTRAAEPSQLCFGDAENKQLFCCSSTLHLPLS